MSLLWGSRNPDGDDRSSAQRQQQNGPHQLTDSFLSEFTEYRLPPTVPPSPPTVPPTTSRKRSVSPFTKFSPSAAIIMGLGEIASIAVNQTFVFVDGFDCSGFVSVDGFDWSEPSGDGGPLLGYLGTTPEKNNVSGGE
ncbi:hypothetical protein L2E82_29746 [Cichorium intybus]|uniref:Uncharacterized protein n=1 Tax=Cichorium intybus TaxID=13427 RepID=A0ACB9CYB5_CICIN|nr:hypothetical protein L2E82_29746 [Cichorium intybus]